MIAYLTVTMLVYVHGEVITKCDVDMVVTLTDRAHPVQFRCDHSCTLTIHHPLLLLNNHFVICPRSLLVVVGIDSPTRRMKSMFCELA
jgi:hypothetical protein